MLGAILGIFSQNSKKFFLIKPKSTAFFPHFAATPGEIPTNYLFPTMTWLGGALVSLDTSHCVRRDKGTLVYPKFLSAGSFRD